MSSTNNGFLDTTTHLKANIKFLFVTHKKKISVNTAAETKKKEHKSL